MTTKTLSRLFIFLLPSLFFVSCKTTAQTKSSYNLVTDFGAVGDNRTNNYTAFKKAAQTLSGTKNKKLVIPKGTYYIADYKIVQGAGKNDITDILFTNADGLSIEGSNSTIRVNGKFKRKADYQQKGVPYWYASNNTVTPFAFTNCKNITIRNVSLNGGVLEMERNPVVVEGWCYGIMINDESPAQVSGNFIIENVRASLFATDGIYIRGNGKNFRINNVTCSRNGRQGLSVVKGRDVLVTNALFDSTGLTGKYGSHAPAAGIDIENEGVFLDIDHVTIRNCVLKHNKGFQLVSTAASNRVTIDSCYVEDLQKGYADGFNGLGIYSANSGISNSIIYGMFQLETAGQPYSGTAPIYVKDNIIFSGRNGLLSADYNTPLDITGNVLVMLPGPVKDQYFPYIQNNNANFSSNIVITNEDKFASHPNRVTGLLQYVSKTENNWWLLGQTAAGKIRHSSSLQSGYYAIAYDGAKKRGKDYFPDNSKKYVSKTSQNDFLADDVISSIFQRSIFTQFSQRTFNKQFLADAAEIRKLLSRYKK